MDLQIFINPLILVICGVIGYTIKHISWLDEVGNEYIPAILAGVGLILVVANAALTGADITLELIASGLLSGVASTGTHQLITKLVDKISE